VKKILFLLLLLIATSSQATSPSADTVMKANFESMKVTDSESDSTLTLTNESGQTRVRKISSKTKLAKGKGEMMRWVRFNSPSDVKGTSILLIEHFDKEDDIWIYLPALKKVRRLVASNKKDSFVGTDFSFGDIIGHKTEDWTHQHIADDKVGDRSCYKVESLPKNEDVKNNSGYSKKISCIDKESFVALSTEIFDTAGKALKKISLSEIKLVDQKNKRYQPMKLEALNLQTLHKTNITFENFKANANIADSVFTPRNLEKQ
jgi:uncharacterized protein